MDYTKILKRAWTILWSYRVLWIFGILVALTSGGGGGNGGNNASFNLNDRDFRGRDFPGGAELGRMLQRMFSDEMMSTWLAVGLALVCLVILLSILAAVVRYVSQTALIRMVDEYERSGEKVGFRQGWRYGWSRAAWRLFLLDLLFSLPIILLVLGVLAAGVLIFATSGMLDGRDPGAAAVAAFIGLVLSMICVVFVVALVVSLVQPVLHRYVVLENAGVVETLRSGFALIRRRFVDVLLMWLILVALGIAYAVVLIPVVLILVAAALLIGGGVGMATYFAVLQMASPSPAIVAGILAGLPFFLLILGVPTTFVEGLRQVYGSTAWTLAYRELRQPPAVAAGAEVFTPPAEPAAANDAGLPPTDL